jgi:hypothetical protein
MMAVIVIAAKAVVPAMRGSFHGGSWLDSDGFCSGII